MKSLRTGTACAKPFSIQGTMREGGTAAAVSILRKCTSFSAGRTLSSKNLMQMLLLDKTKKQNKQSQKRTRMHRGQYKTMHSFDYEI